MRHVTTLALLLVGGFVAWRIGESLSSDAISMGLGIFFGMLAGVPASLLVLAATRRREIYDDERPSVRPMGDGAGGYGHQPPVIVLAGMGNMPQQGLLPQQSSSANLQPYLDYSSISQPRQAREYRIVGGREESVEDW
jgi:Zn-dependent protease with chaperone function